MPTITFRKRQGFAHIPTKPLAESIVPAFDMSCLPGFFADTPMRFDRNDLRRRLPKIAETGTPPVGEGNPVPQPSTRPFAAVANHKRDDLACPPTLHRPQPPFPSAFPHKRPNFIEFQHIGGIGGHQGRLQRRERFEFFFIQAASALRDTAKIRLMPRILGRS